jgi:hypothetical protein
MSRFVTPSVSPLALNARIFAMASDRSTTNCVVYAVTPGLVLDSFNDGIGSLSRYFWDATAREWSVSHGYLDREALLEIDSLGLHEDWLTLYA